MREGNGGEGGGAGKVPRLGKEYRRRVSLMGGENAFDVCRGSVVRGVYGEVIADDYVA